MRVTFAALPSGEVPAFGIMYVSAALRQAGHDVRLVEVESAAALVSALRRSPTDLLAISATTGLHRIYLSWARAAKRALRVPTLFGGPHPTFFPEIIDRPEVDAIVVGEGECTAKELLEALATRDGRVVAGASYKLEGRIVTGPPRPPEQELDRLPLPDRAIYFDQNALHRTFPVKAFLASRGCPYRCTYCFNRTLNDMYRGQSRAVRLRSPSMVVDEIRHVRRAWPTKLVWFLDANFVVSRSWVEELSSRIRREIGLPFYCKVRPNLVDERLAHTLARGGCTGVGMGIEAGDDGLRNGLLERNVAREQIVRACRLLHEAGISIMSFNMVGLPGERYAQVKDTIDLNVEAGVDYAMATVFQPYPRTVLGEWAESNGFFDGDYDRLDTNYYSTCVMREVVPGDRVRIENAQRLFALAVAFPEIRKHLDRLVELPVGRFYTELFKRWHSRRFFEGFYERYENPKRASLPA